MKKAIYKCKAKVWVYPSETASWHFVGVPKSESEAIKKAFKAVRRGWGSLPVLVTLGQSVWRTSIFPEKTSGCYLLPLKAKVRKDEEIEEGDTISFTIEIVS